MQSRKPGTPRLPIRKQRPLLPAVLAALPAAVWCAAAAFAAAPPAPVKPAPKPAPAAASTGTPVSREQEEFFETQVRPLLAASCFGCHSSSQQMGGLRLDSRAAVMKGGKRGPSVVPGDPAKSPLVQAVEYHGALKMPPAGKLKPEQITALSQWVKIGAPWPATLAAAPWKKHWAFQPVKNPPLPAVKDRLWAQDPIDRFVLARLEAKGLKPAKPADQRTLIRRATYDLLGLPPTQQEIDAFAADRSPDAFQKVVDRLLASPRYGERWARYWLDIARYADTKGYVFQEERRYPFAYTYRDYVIRAFNDDLPYDQFLVQQIAADHLELGEDKKPLAALGFLTLGRRFLNSQPDIIDDRIDVVSRGTMALTVTCARCHDHKFDPIPTKDYYSLYGVFASSVEPKDLPLISKPEPSAAYEAYEKELKQREGEVAKFLEKRRADTITRLRAQVADYMLAEQELKGQQTIEKARSVARARDLNGIVLGRWHRMLEDSRKSHDSVFAPWHAFAALPANEFAAKAPGVAAAAAANADPQKRVNPVIAAAFAAPRPAPTSLREVAQRYAEQLAAVDKEWQALQAQPAAGGKAPSALADASREALRQVVYGPNAPTSVSPDEFDRLLNRDDRNQLQALQRKVDQLKATSPAAPARAMVLVDAPMPVEPRVFIRGNQGNQGETVPRQFLSVIAGEKREPFKTGSGRLDMAKAIASPENPLTARVMVNRLWMQHFGAPLVRTPGDFGLRSDPPTHPELLDYLARQFVADGWSVKKMHRRIMLSRTYQQSSEVSPQGLRLDPENRLLGRMNRRRLDFEAMRDSLLAVSGQLDLTMGGPSVQLTGDSPSRRRAVYGFIERQNLPGMFRTFDFASPDTTTPQRHSTTVPQQALFMMNSPFVMEQARALVARPEVDSSAGAAKVDRLYRLVYGRAPTVEERDLGLKFIATAESPAPRNIALQELQKPPVQPAPATAPMTAWEKYAQVLLLSNEFLFID